MDNENQVQEQLRLFELTVPFEIEVLKERYRDLVQVWHPDRYAHNERLKTKADEKLKLINQAYENLSNNRDFINKHFSSESKNNGKKSKSAPKSKSEKYISLGSSAIEARNFEEAYKYFSKALEADPESHLAWLGKGTSSGWQSTFFNHRLAEMRACYLKSLEFAPPDRRDALKEGIAAVTMQVVNSLFQTCKNTLVQALPTAGVDASGVPQIWINYLVICTDMVFVLEEAHAALPAEPDPLRLIIAICRDNLQGVKYTDPTTVQFNNYVTRTLFISEKLEQAYNKKLLDYGEKLRALDPTYVAPQVQKVSAGCFVATCACGTPDHPYVLALSRFRDEKLCKSVTGRGIIRAYNQFGPHLAAFVAPKRRLRKVLMLFLIRPLACLSGTLLRQ